MDKYKTHGSASPKISIRSISYIALFVALMAVCAWISIPFTVPFTLQTFAVFAAVGLLGTKRAAVAVCVYILLGATGVPVLSNFTGGMGVLLGMTGGYLIGFLPAALLSGVLMDRFGNKIPVMAGAMALGLLVCYAFGTAWFMRVYLRTKGAISLWGALSMCVFPFVVPDAVKIALAIFITKRVSARVHLN